MAMGTSFKITLSGESFNITQGYSLSAIKDSEIV